MRAERGASLRLRGRKVDVRAVAAYDVGVPDAGPGDTRAVAFVWVERNGRVETVFADHEHYGDQALALVSLSTLEEIESQTWSVLTGRLGGAGWAAGTIPGIGEIEADSATCTLRRAGGPEAGGCPPEGWLVDAYPELPGSRDGIWLAIFDSRQTPRRAFRIVG